MSSLVRLFPAIENCLILVGGPKPKKDAKVIIYDFYQLPEMENIFWKFAHTFYKENGLYRLSPRYCCMICVCGKRSYSPRKLRRNIKSARSDLVFTSNLFFQYLRGNSITLCVLAAMMKNTPDTVYEIPVGKWYSSQKSLFIHEPRRTDKIFCNNFKPALSISKE